MAVMTMSNVQLFSHGLFRISQYDKSVMNNQFLLFWFILEMLQTLTSILNQDFFDFHSSDTKKKPQSYDFYLNFDFIICSSAD